MKIAKLFYFSLLILIITSCSKEKTNPESSIEFIVRNTSGNTVSGATIKLFTSEMDFINKTNQLGNTIISNADGIAVFKGDIRGKLLWFLAEKDCQNNINNAFRFSDPISTSPGTTEATVIVTQTGELLMQSTSSNPYRIFIDGVARIDLNGGASIRFKNLSAGSHNVRVLQLSGYLVSPTDKTYAPIITCGGLNTISFP